MFTMKTVNVENMSEELTKWCQDCEEVVIPADQDGSYFCPKCGKFLGGCRVINMAEWERKKIEKRYKDLCKHIIENEKSF